jgi:5-methylthioadenosine/S-adenosylhomocysteine deaminase
MRSHPKRLAADYIAGMRTVFTSARLICCDSAMSVVDGDLHIENGKILGIEPSGSPLSPDWELVDCQGGWLLPGFVQSHIHLVQTLFRGLADDLQLMDWLSRRVWPLEAAHDEESVYWSARLGITELLLGGTSSILDMATVHHTDAVFRAAEEAGIRAQIGQAMMDRANDSGLSQPIEGLMEESCGLADKWHGKERLGYAFAPRFVPSCSPELLEQCIGAARDRGCLIHTHASENLEEVELVRKLTGMDNVEYLHSIGMTGPDVVLAHCIHLTDAEREILRSTRTTVAHCPGSNMKLGSGIAPIPELLEQGVLCTIGADGAPCNNRLDVFAEMRLAALIQKPRLGAHRMRADQVLEMATRHGAKALGLNSGFIAPGRDADLVLLDPDQVHAWGGGEPASTLVYAMTPAAVRAHWIAGHQVVSDGQVVGWSTEETLSGCREALSHLRERCGI